jgi:hypothetical protein
MNSRQRRTSSRKRIRTYTQAPSGSDESHTAFWAIRISDVHRLWGRDWEIEFNLKCHEHPIAQSPEHEDSTHSS